MDKHLFVLANLPDTRGAIQIILEAEAKWFLYLSVLIYSKEDQTLNLTSWQDLPVTLKSRIYAVVSENSSGWNGLDTAV
jgi:hypothetical protein